MKRLATAFTVTTLLLGGSVSAHVDPTADLSALRAQSNGDHALSVFAGTGTPQQTRGGSQLPQK